VLEVVAVEDVAAPVAVEAGADAVLGKDAAPEEIVSSVRRLSPR
jgi:predicted nicotinamide N-methyase